jgi:transposase-like protein
MAEDNSKRALLRIGDKLYFVAHLEEHHFTQPEPIKCKWCGSVDIKKYGVRDSVQEYICLKCNRKFIDKDAPFKKQSTFEQIGTSISSYYDGLSFADVARHLAESGNPVRDSTVYRWIISYTQKAIQVFDSYKPIVSNIWIADETSIKFDKELYWLWDIIDRNTRFLLATYLSPNRGTKDARVLMETASKRAGKVPKTVITDKLAGYLDGIELAFGADTRHIQSSPFSEENDTNLIERFHGTLKDRTKVVRGFKTFDTASLILEGFRIHYDFFKPHLSLKELPPKGQDKTPAEVAGINSPYKTWTDLVRSDK